MHFNGKNKLGEGFLGKNAQKIRKKMSKFVYFDY